MAYALSGEAYGGMIMQNYQIGYNQTITKLRGLNTNDVIAVVAPPNGTLTITSTIASAKSYYEFVGNYGDACFTANNNLQIAPQSDRCDPSNIGYAGRWMEGGTDVYENQNVSLNANTNVMIGYMPDLTLKGCLINGLQINQAIENLVMSSTLNMEFVALDKTKGREGSWTTPR